jgi:hypothetical protein
VKPGDLVMASEAYSHLGSYGRIKGLVTRILDPTANGMRLERIEVMLTSTGRRVSFLTEELEVVNESR